jgi:hypothetical protein
MKFGRSVKQHHQVVETVPLLINGANETDYVQGIGPGIIPASNRELMLSHGQEANTHPSQFVYPDSTCSLKVLSSPNHGYSGLTAYAQCVPEPGFPVIHDVIIGKTKHLDPRRFDPV